MEKSASLKIMVWLLILVANTRVQIPHLPNLKYQFETRSLSPDGWCDDRPSILGKFLHLLCWSSSILYSWFTETDVTSVFCVYNKCSDYFVPFSGPIFNFLCKVKSNASEENLFPASPPLSSWSWKQTRTIQRCWLLFQTGNPPAPSSFSWSALRLHR